MYLSYALYVTANNALHADVIEWLWSILAAVIVIKYGLKYGVNSLDWTMKHETNCYS